MLIGKRNAYAARNANHRDPELISVIFRQIQQGFFCIFHQKQRSIFRRDDFFFPVIEMGMNHFGEIALLSGIVRPDIGVISNVGVAHIENLGSREGMPPYPSWSFCLRCP